MKHLLMRAFMYFVYALSCIVPRRSTQYACVGWHKKTGGEVFADNSKYFYLFLSKQPGVQAIWLAKSEAMAAELRAAGLVSFYAFSLRGIWAALRSGNFVVDAFLQPETFALSGRARIIQLLHGKGMKKKGYGEKPLRTQAFIFGPSPYTFNILPSIFSAGSKKIVAGYSRNDVLFDPTIEHADISVDRAMLSHLQVQRAAGKQVVLYAPTFRRGQKVFDINALLPLQALESWAAEHQVHVVLSLHNKYRAQQNNGEQGEHISYLSEGDVYPLLPQIDVLITDYSSLFADYLLLDRPLLFYCYDLETYSQNEGIVGDYEEITPGPKVRTFPELLRTLESALATKGTDWKEARERVRHLYHTYQDGKSSERIFDAIKTPSTTTYRASS